MRSNLQTSRKGSQSYLRRKENLEKIRKLSLVDLEYNSVEMQIPIVTTTSGEKIVIQYPGKESMQGNRKWKNEWDFRPKVIKEGNIDLTFQQIWDPLFYQLNLLQGEDRQRVGQALAATFYRMAYMVAYEKEAANSHNAVAISTSKALFERRLPADVQLGSFWLYRPPRKTLDMISHLLSNWAGMSFEAFLHYNGLLAWNEDCKMFAKFKEDWTPSDARGRINTLLTHVRVIGFVLGNVRPSTLLGGFASMRGMSPASPKEVKAICNDLII